MSYHSDHSSYQASPLSPREPSAFVPSYPPPTPGVWYGYIVYCLLMAFLYLLCLGGGIFFIVFAEQIAADDPSPNAELEPLVMGVILAVMGAVLMLMYAIAPLLPKCKASWIYGFVTIGIGMTSACTLPFCIALLIFWLKPETKAFFRAS